MRILQSLAISFLVLILLSVATKPPSSARSHTASARTTGWLISPRVKPWLVCILASRILELCLTSQWTPRVLCLASHQITITTHLEFCLHRKWWRTSRTDRWSWPQICGSKAWSTDALRDLSSWATKTAETLPNYRIVKRLGKITSALTTKPILKASIIQAPSKSIQTECSLIRTYKAPPVKSVATK